MDESWPLQSFGDLPLFRWEDVNQDAPTSARNYPPIQESAASDITSLLSTRSHPPPDSYISETPQNQESCLPSDAVPADQSHQQKTAQTSLLKSTPRRSVKSQGRRTKTGASSNQKPGKPRETVMESPHDGPDEVCSIYIYLYKPCTCIDRTTAPSHAASPSTTCVSHSPTSDHQRPRKPHFPSGDHFGKHELYCSIVQRAIS